MKRLMSITLAVVLVLALGSWALASEGGTLDTTHPDYEALKVEIPPVSAKIGPMRRFGSGRIMKLISGSW